MKAFASALVLALAGLGSGCIPSNVVARDDRRVVDDLTTLQFAPGTAAVLPGMWRSVSITGDAALSMRFVNYLFVEGGTYTAAALIDDAGNLSFQTIQGTWAVAAAGLTLDGASPVEFGVAPEHVRIAAPGGVLVLRREPLP